MIAPQPQSAWQPEKAGLFSLPEAVYRPSPGVNQSTLKQVLRSPAHARSEMDNPKEPTPAMVIGTLAHLACLEPEQFEDGQSHYVVPDFYETTGMKCPSCGTVTDSKKCRGCKTDREEVIIEKPWTGNSETCREWLANHSDKPVITRKDVRNLAGMQVAMNSNPIARRVMNYGHPEVAAFSYHTDTGTLFKAKIDKLFTDDDGRLWISDMKKVQDARAFERDAITFGYDLQAAFYTDILRNLGLVVEGFLFVVVEEEPPHGIICYQADMDFIARGRTRYLRALTAYIEADTSGKWPSYTEEVRSLNVPGWAKD